MGEDFLNRQPELGGIDNMSLPPRRLVPTVTQTNQQAVSSETQDPYNSYEIQKALENIATPMEGVPEAIAREQQFTSNDFFPALDQPINQGTYGGKTFSAPILAAPGAVMPFAALAKFQHNRRLEDAAKAEAFAKANALDFSRTAIKNPKLDMLAGEAYINFWNGEIDRGKKMAGEKYGIYLKNDPEHIAKKALFNNFFSSLNDDLDLSEQMIADQRVAKETKGKDMEWYVDPIGLKAAYELRQGKDEVLSNPNMNINDLNTWVQSSQKNREKLLVSKGLNDVLLNTAESLKKTNESEMQWFDKNKSSMSNSDISVYIKNKLKTPFIKEEKDKAGNIIGYGVDEDANKKYWVSTYETNTGNKVEEDKNGNFKIVESGLPVDRQYPADDFIKRGMKSITRIYEPLVEKIDTKATEWARIDLEKKKELAQINYSTNVERNIGGTNQPIAYKTAWESDNPVSAHGGRFLMNTTTGQPYKMQGNEELFVNGVELYKNEQGTLNPKVVLVKGKRVPETTKNSDGELVPVLDDKGQQVYKTVPDYEGGTFLGEYSDFKPNISTITVNKKPLILPKTVEKVLSNTKEYGESSNQPQNTPTQTSGTTKFTVGGKVYNIPNDEVEEFKKAKGIK